MALFTDPEIFTIDDLSAHETAILDTAVTEGIDLTSKLGLAQEEIGVELLARFERRRAYDAQAPLQLSNVVVTGPLRLWHTFHTLAMVYRDAYNNQLNDRYEGKWNQYRELARWASGALLQIGVGIVWNPLEQPGAAELTYVAGTQPETTYYVRISWVNTRGEESASGSLASLAVPAGNVLQVTALNPPANAMGWNVYAGAPPAELTLQNNTPLDLMTSWVEPNGGLVTGKPVSSGQLPNYLRKIPQVLQRG